MSHANDNLKGEQPDPTVRALIQFAAQLFQDLAPWEIDDLEREITADRNARGHTQGD